MTPTQYREELVEMLLEIQSATQSVPGLRFYLGYGTALGAVRDRGLISWDFDVDILVPWPDYEGFTNCLLTRLPPGLTVHRPTCGRAYEEPFVRVSPSGVHHQLMHVDVFPLVGAPSGRARQAAFWRVAKAATTIHRLQRLDPAQRHWWTRRRRMEGRAVSTLSKALVPRRAAWHVLQWLATRSDFDSAASTYSLCGSYGRREFTPRAMFQQPAQVTFEGRLLPLPSHPQVYLRRLYGDYLTIPSAVDQAKQVAWFVQNVLPHVSMRDQNSRAARRGPDGSGFTPVGRGNRVKGAPSADR